MLEFVDIKSVMRVIAEKILLNLAYTNCDQETITIG